MANKKDDIVLGANEEVQRKKGHNIFPKVLSVLLAFVLWFYVMTVESPVNEKEFDNIPIEVLLPNSGEMSLYSGYNVTVNVTVKGKRRDLNQISADEIKAIADASTYTQAGKHSIPVSIELPGNVTLVDKSVELLSVYLGTKATAAVPIQIVYENYYLNQGIELGVDNEVKINPSEIFVTGPRNILDTIETARVTIDCGGKVTSSFNASGKVQLIDAEGNAVTNPYVTIESAGHDNVDVSVPVYMTKDITLKVGFVNGLLDTSNSNVEVSPSVIKVRGTVESLSKLEDNEYVFHMLDEKTLINDSDVLNVPITLPDGLKCTDGTEKAVINITHKGTVTKTFSVENFDVNNPRKLKYKFDYETVNITLRGKSDDISKVTAEDITLSIDMSDVKEGAGSITLPIKVNIADSHADVVYDIGEYNMVVTVE